MPFEGEIPGAAHELLLMGEMVFDGGDQTVKNLLDLEKRCASTERLLEFARRLEDRAVLVVDFGEENGIGFMPLEKAHVPFYTITGLTGPNLRSRPKSIK
jgi:hypothetical protein